MEQTMQTTLAAISLIKQYEGFRPDAYIDPLGHPTIGFGNTTWEDGEPVQLGDEISRDDAERLLFDYVRKEVEPTLSSIFGDLALQPNQRDALASFVYNLGPDHEGKYPTLVELVKAGASDEDIALQLVKYRNAGSSAELGLYRRRVAEALMWAGLEWECACEIKLTDHVLDVMTHARNSHSEVVEQEVYEPPARNLKLPENWVNMTPNQQTQWLNLGEAKRAATGENRIGVPVPAGPVKVEKRVDKVDVSAVPYLNNNAAPSVKRIDDSQRGKGYAKTQTGKELGTAAVIGTAATATGAIEPVVQFVDKYPKDTIAYVFFALLIFAVVYYYYGQWQRQKGEDEAEDLLA